MANVPESASYDAGIYQLEIVDAVIGGVNGISNLQAKGLANRTNWLKAQVDALNLLKGAGTPAFSAANSYTGGQQVIYQKNIWQANTAISPGAFNPANWTRQLGVAAESALADAVPLMAGTAAVGTSTDLAREDHIHPTDTSRAPLASPVFTGNPTGPTPPQFDNDVSLVTSAFVKQSGTTLSGFVPFNATATLSNSAAGGIVEFYGSTAGQTLTLPLSASARSADVITIFNYATVPVTIARPGAEVINTGANGSVNSLVMQPGDSLVLVAGSGWFVAGGTVANQFSASFGALMATNGYQKLPSGLIIQWGQATVVAGTVTTVTFPIGFPANCASAAVLAPTSSTTADRFIATSDATLTTMTLISSGPIGTVRWIAIGY